MIKAKDIKVGDTFDIESHNGYMVTGVVLKIEKNWLGKYRFVLSYRHMNIMNNGETYTNKEIITKNLSELYPRL